KARFVAGYMRLSMRAKTARAHVGLRSSSPDQAYLDSNSRDAAVAAYSHCASVGKSPPSNRQKALAVLHPTQLSGWDSLSRGDEVKVQFLVGSSEEPCARSRSLVSSSGSSTSGSGMPRA